MVNIRSPKEREAMRARANVSEQPKVPDSAAVVELVARCEAQLDEQKEKGTVHVQSGAFSQDVVDAVVAHYRGAGYNARHNLDDRSHHASGIDRIEITT